jgi:oxalate---CoA ligase
MATYVPPRLDADVLCLLSEEYSARKEYAAAPWRGLARHLTVERTPGKHNTCITSHVDALARTMSRLLAA